eukprot:CAMPEP_0119558046 /NCGR_PEP_ID=MMETSP1352-20130426/9930_1 /TAXON_ID=265584 /ORGANISM="Stauroneis constricta, Strain CCMP1120" /LENGTH=42 /DNA_ID= /DNA_START= /DNA_END= /DNA_ORIENTATION=
MVRLVSQLVRLAFLAGVAAAAIVRFCAWRQGSILGPLREASA